MMARPKMVNNQSNQSNQSKIVCPCVRGEHK